MRILPFVLVAALALCIGCDSKPTHESIREEMVGKMKDTLAIFKSIKDEDSAKAAKPKLEAIEKEIKAMAEEDEKLGTLTPEKDAELKKKLEPEMNKVQAEIGKEIERIAADPKLSGAMGEISIP